MDFSAQPEQDEPKHEGVTMSAPEHVDVASTQTNDEPKAPVVSSATADTWTPSPTVSPAAQVVTPPAVPAAASREPVQPDSIRPIPVVRVLSPAGVEYVFMTIALFTGAIALAAALIALVNGKTSFAVLAFPTAALVVSVPVFAALFLRLKKLEQINPDMRLDPSKRRSTQFTQIISFLVSFFTIVGLVATVFAKLGGQSGESIGKVMLDSLCILAVFGGVLFYYWRDEHKAK